MPALRSKTRMPPKAPRVPKKPVIANPKERPSPKVMARVLFKGGPYAGKQAMLPLCDTMVFSARGRHGRYRHTPEWVGVTGKTRTYNALVYTWEDIAWPT